MSNDLIINPHLAMFYYPNKLLFTLPYKDIRSSSLRGTITANTQNLLQFALVTEGRVTKHQKGKPQLNSYFKTQGGFDLDSFRSCAAVNRVINHLSSRSVSCGPWKGHRRLNTICGPCVLQFFGAGGYSDLPKIKHFLLKITGYCVSLCRAGDIDSRSSITENMALTGDNFSRGRGRVRVEPSAHYRNSAPLGKVASPFMPPLRRHRW